MSNTETKKPPATNSSPANGDKSSGSTTLARHPPTSTDPTVRSTDPSAASTEPTQEA